MHFFTATINSWKHLLAADDMKDVVINSLRWLDNNEKAFTHGFVVMPNHIHILWSIVDVSYYVNASFISYTAHEFKKRLNAKDPGLLKAYESTQNDRAYHFWERRSRSMEIKSRAIAIQKLNYIHHNPLQPKWNLAELPEQYRYSSARYYMQMPDEFEFLKHYTDFS